MEKGAKSGKIPKVTGNPRRYPSIYRVRSLIQRLRSLRIRRLRGFAEGVSHMPRMARTWLAHARARCRLLSGPRLAGAPARLGARLCEARTHAAAGRSFGWGAGCFGLGLLLGRIRRGHVARMTQQPRWLSSLMTQQPGDSAGHMSLSKRGWRGNCVTMRNFSVFVPKLLKSITFAYELRFLRSLYARVAKITIYNFRLDFVG